MPVKRDWMLDKLLDSAGIPSYGMGIMFMPSRQERALPALRMRHRWTCPFFV